MDSYGKKHLVAQMLNAGGTAQSITSFIKTIAPDNPMRTIMALQLGRLLPEQASIAHEALVPGRQITVWAVEGEPKFTVPASLSVHEIHEIVRVVFDIPVLSYPFTWTSE